MSGLVTLDRMNALLFPEGAAPPAPNTDRDADVRRLIDGVTQTIQATCRQTFAAATGDRAFVPPASTLLQVGPIRVLTTVTLLGTDITGDVRLWPPTPDPLVPGPYTALEYRPGGVPTLWANALPPTGFDVSGAVVVTGDWGWAAVPPVVAWVAEIAVARAWAARTAQYAAPEGVSPLGTPLAPPVVLSADLIDLLTRGGYVRSA